MMIMVIILMWMLVIYNVLFMIVIDFINFVILYNEWIV